MSPDVAVWCLLNWDSASAFATGCAAAAVDEWAIHFNSALLRDLFDQAVAGDAAGAAEKLPAVDAIMRDRRDNGPKVPTKALAAWTTVRQTVTFLAQERHGWQVSGIATGAENAYHAGDPIERQWADLAARIGLSANETVLWVSYAEDWEGNLVDLLDTCRVLGAEPATLP